MYIVYDEAGLSELGHIEASKEAPVLVDQFLEDAFEYDLDAVCDGESLYIGGILQHIEAAGIHSGDSAAVFPPYKSSEALLEQMQEWAHMLARELRVRGLMNIQFAAKDGLLYLIEVNPRASRTVPFISKTSNVDLIECAVRIWEGEDLVSQGLVKKRGGRAMGTCKTGWAVKEAVFSFDRFSNVDPALGPEMRSTGESIGLGKTFGEAFAKSQISAGNRLPIKGKVFVSVNKKDRITILPVVQNLIRLGFSIAATRGTAAFLFEHGLVVEVMQKVHEGRPNVTDYLKDGQIALVINTPMGYHAHASDDEIRSIAMRVKIPYTTTTSAAIAAVEAIGYLQKKQVVVRSLTS
jgi:carbamoyl-phosphate synthase large subunit